MTQEEIREVRAIILSALLEYEERRRQRRVKTIRKTLQGSITAMALGGTGCSLGSHGRIDKQVAMQASAEAALTATLKPAEPRSVFEQTVGGIVHFGSGSRKLGLAHKERLDALIAQLPPEAELKIVGYADAKGGREANFRLGKQRAKVVAAYLMQRGIGVRGIESRGESEGTIGWSARRVDVLLSYSGTQAAEIKLPELARSQLALGSGPLPEKMPESAGESSVGAPVQQETLPLPKAHFERNDLPITALRLQYAGIYGVPVTQRAMRDNLKRLKHPPTTPGPIGSE